MEKKSNYFLTPFQFVLGKFFNLLEYFQKRINWENHIDQNHKLTNYEFVRSLTILSDKKYDSEVSLRRDNLGNLVIVKILNYIFPNLKYRQMFNEASMLKLIDSLNKLNKRENQFHYPKLINFYKRDKKLILVQEYIQGVMLHKVNREKKIKIIENCLNKLEKLSSKLNKIQKIRLPKRTAFFIFLIFPYYFGMAAIKNYKIFPNLLKACLLFYKYLPTLIFNTNLVLSHRDLHSNNIILQKDTPYIVDVEVCVLAEKWTDLAIVSRYYINEIGQYKILDLIKDKITTFKDKKIFLTIAIYYALQALAIEKRENKAYHDADTYLPFLFRSVVPLNL